MISRIASVTVGGLVPSMASAVAAYQAKLTNELAARVRLSGLVSVTMPSITAVAAASAAVVAAVAARGPSVKFNATAQLALIAALRLQLAAFAKLFAALGQAGLEVYSYDGTAAAFGSEVAGETKRGLPGGLPNDHMNALIIATRIPAAWAALGEVLLTS